MPASMIDGSAVRRFVEALFGSAPPGSFVEVRFRRGDGMGQSFYPAAALREVVTEVTGLAASTDVFVGVLPRARRGGGRRDLVEGAGVLWVDCDAPEAVARLEAFRPKPSMVVASGAPGHLHAYWLLVDPLSLEAAEQANRRLAWTLGSVDQLLAGVAGVM